MTAPEQPEDRLVDQLTGLPTRGYLDRVLASILAKREASRKPLSLLLFDINHLDELNDLYGRSAGDQILAKVAGLLRSNVKSGDPVVRFGGDEFVILLEDEDRDVAKRVAQRLVDRVASEPLTITGKVLRVTVCASVVAFPVDGADAQALCESACRVLEAGKKGRD